MLGATPALLQSGAYDPNADGVILLAHEGIAATGYPAVLAHEMVHLLARIPHTATPASTAWYLFLSVFSFKDDPLKAVWNGRSGSDAGII